MEELIKKIIQVDKEARKKTDQSKQQLADSKIAIEQRKKELEEQYNNSVNEIIELTTQEEEERVTALKAEIDEKFNNANAALEKTFLDNKQAWVDELVKRAIKE